MQILRRNKVGSPVVFTHIPKCGGSSIRESVRGRLKKELLTPYKGPARKAFREDPVGHLKEYRAVFGHFEFPMFQSVIGQATFFTVLRDPVERIVSLLAYHRWNENAPHRKLVDGATDRDALTILLSPRLANYNDMTRYFGRPDDPHAAFKVAQKYYAHIGHMEELGETFAWLKEIGISDGEPVQLNAAPEPYDVSFRDRAFIRAHIMDDIRLHDMLVA